MITVPIWPEFLIPVLTVLSDGESRSSREVRSASFDLLQLDEQARAEVLPSGESRAHNRAGWAITYLHRARWIERVSRGTYRITEAGRAALAEHGAGFHDYAAASAVLDKFWEKPTAGPTLSGATLTVAPAVDPMEQIEAGVAELNDSVAQDLLHRLRTSDPTFFEEAVVTLLLAMGYGGSEQRGKRIGGTGDGGVDGVIDQDALGLDQIYVQAKRYAAGNRVGREAIQAFIGALHGFGAGRGVFITTSSFTTHAVEYARTIPTRIVLIDGERLTALMTKHRVGVQVRQRYEVVEIDEDFFD